jgi:hypothetical protein
MIKSETTLSGLILVCQKIDDKKSLQNTLFQIIKKVIKTN